MQLLVTAEQMQQFDRAAIEKYKIAGLVLMENAGRAFVDQLRQRMPALSRKRILVMCGRGNNGGDGFVIARHLVNGGCAVHVALLCKKGEVSGDAATNLTCLLKMVAADSAPLSFQELTSARHLSGLPESDIIVDAIFGTGFSGSVMGIQEKAIAWVNARSAFVVAVDIPSGVTASTGIVENAAVRANLTVTMGLAKIGHFVGAGRDHSGEVVPVDISIPTFLFRVRKDPVFLIHGSDVAAALPKRSLSAHKHSVGKVFVLAGSRTLTGAPFMCAQSAMRTGAGAVILGIPKCIHAAMARKVTEVMPTPLEETAEGSVSWAALPIIREKVEWADVIAIGPGLSQNAETQRVVLEVLKFAEKPVVLDADGLNAVASTPAILKSRRYPTILTPHVGELRRLIAVDAEEIDTLRVAVARKAAKQLKSIIMLKGAPTVTATPDGSCYVNSTGNPGMATAGSGDVLTGIVVSLMGQGMEPRAAAYAGAFIHGLAGDRAAGKLGELGLLAMDIQDQLPDALKIIQQAWGKSIQ